ERCADALGTKTCNTCGGCGLVGRNRLTRAAADSPPGSASILAMSDTLARECPLHGGCGQIHLSADVRCDVVRQHVDDPVEPALRLALGNHLNRGAMLFYSLADDRIDEPSPRLVAVDQKLARNSPISEADDPCFALQPGVKHKARHQARMQRSEIAHRIPH